MQQTFARSNDACYVLATGRRIAYNVRFVFLSSFFSLQWARLTSMESPSAEGLIEELFALNQRLGLPTKLREKGVEEAHLEALSDLAIADFAHPNNPKPVSRADFRAIYQKAW